MVVRNCVVCVSVVIVTLYVLTLPSIVQAKSAKKHRLTNNRESNYQKKLIELVKEAKRVENEIELCGLYQDWCKPHSLNPALECCPGYRCKCSLWNSACRCHRSSIFARI